MSWNKAVIQAINPNVVQVRDDKVAIGFPGGEAEDVFIFACHGTDPGLVREKLLEWLKQHLQANGVVFG